MDDSGDLDREELRIALRSSEKTAFALAIGEGQSLRKKLGCLRCFAVSRT